MTRKSFPRSEDTQQADLQSYGEVDSQETQAVDSNSNDTQNPGDLSDSEQFENRSESRIAAEFVEKERQREFSLAVEKGVGPEQFNNRYQPARLYLAFCETKNTLSTARAYESCLGYYTDYLHDVLGLQPHEVRLKGVLQFIDFAAYTVLWSESSLTRCLSAIRGLHDYLYKDDEFPDPIITTLDLDFKITDVVTPEGDTIQRVPLTRQEVSILLDSTTNPRDHLICQLAYQVGLRNSDVRTLLISDVDLDERRLYVMNSKGGKDYTVPLPINLALEIEKFLAVSREAIPYSQEHDYLIPSRLGGRLSEHRLIDIVRDAAVRGGIQDTLGTVESPDIRGGGESEIRTFKKVTPHALRHSIITHLEEDGVPISIRQALAGHSQSTTTETYSHGDDTVFDVLSEALESY